MRGGPSTGYPTGPSQADIMQAKWGTHGDHPVITLTPSTVPEILTETIRAFNLAEKYRMPVFVFYDEIIGHMREPVEVPEPGDYEVIDREKVTCKPEDYLPFDTTKEIPPLAPFGEGYRFHVTGLNHNPDGFPTNDSKVIDFGNRRIMDKVENNKKEIWKNDTFMVDDAEIGIFAFGSTARSARFAAERSREDGIKVGLLKPLTIWPFPEDAVRDMAKTAKVIIVPEMNLGQTKLEIERIAPNSKIVGINRVDGEPITPAEIMAVIDEYK